MPIDVELFAISTKLTALKPLATNGFHGMPPQKSNPCVSPGICAENDKLAFITGYAL